MLSTTRVTIPARLEAAVMAASTRGVAKRFGQTVALRGVDLTVPAGAFYLLVGANGAGKSTLLKVLLDLVRADAGIAEVFGDDTTAGARARTRIGYVPERHDEPYGWMRVNRLFAHHACYYPAWDTHYATHLARELGIKQSVKLARLSKGEARRVQLVLALAHRPPLLLLDEPTDGLDPTAREVVLGLVAEHLADTPTTVLASTHLVYELETLADHVGVLCDGALFAQLACSDLAAHLRSYTLDLTAVAAGHVYTDLTVFRSDGGPREARWLIWGDEEDVLAQLAAAGAIVLDVNPVRLEQATKALLTHSAQGATSSTDTSYAGAAS